MSQLKTHVGPTDFQLQLPVLDNDGLLVKKLLHILDKRMKKVGNVATIEVLVRLSNAFPEDDIWEELTHLRQRYPQFHP